MKIKTLLAILLGLLIVSLTSCFPGDYYPDNPGTYQPQAQHRERCDCRSRCHKVLKPNARYSWETFNICEYRCLNQYGAPCR